MSDTAQDNDYHFYEVEVIQTRIVKFTVKAESEDDASSIVLDEEFFETEESFDCEIIEETNDSVASVICLD